VLHCGACTSLGKAVHSCGQSPWFGASKRVAGDMRRGAWHTTPRTHPWYAESKSGSSFFRCTQERVKAEGKRKQRWVKAFRACALRSNHCGTSAAFLCAVRGRAGRRRVSGWVCVRTRGRGVSGARGDTWHTSWIRSHCAGVGSTPVGLCAHACSRMTDPGAAPCAHTRLARRALVAARSVMLRDRHWSGGANGVPLRTSRSDSIPAKSRPRVAASQ